MFIVKRAPRVDVPGPNFLLIVLNKLGIENMLLDLSQCMKARVQDPYIMLKCSMNGATIILGLWFHSGDERGSIMSSIESVLAQMSSIAAQGTSSKTEPEMSRNLLKGVLNVKPKKSDDASSSLKSVLSGGSTQQSSAVSNGVKLISPSDFTGIRREFYE